jgi:hypothetical protein
MKKQLLFQEKSFKLPHFLTKRTSYPTREALPFFSSA